ncbi:DprA-like DNA processing chain A [Streptomyces phage Maya]|uniref:DprA-like DNA processing chain A n=4 Tax=Rimavirus rima TaxID=2560784 RepID=A0A5J6D952_9CAUD|nr:DprA-like DNA processing chain A [Streptomyces phage CherryBlossom]QEQ94015.1 DprA-like DNA processing chain A [Streptomyces phage Meibysrarus]QNN98235.1 DprA-like DNA processing chain A [Streptomyces phage Maya]
MRVLVTGSRDWSDRDAVWDALDDILGAHQELTLVHGDCPTGADRYADDWALDIQMLYGEDVVSIERHPADWNGPRKRGAGFARNAEMVKLGADLCLAFIRNESNGATHCSELAEKAGIKTQIFRSNSNMSQLVRRVDDEITLEGARIIYRNFAGNEGMYNAKGYRNFHVVLDPVQGEAMLAAGWNVKVKPPREEGELPFYHLKVNVKFDGPRPPRIFLVTMSTNSRTQIEEDLVGMMDWGEFDNIDLKISPYNYNIGGKQGVSAYLKSMFAILHEDDLDKKYAHIPIEGAPAQIPLEGGVRALESDQSFGAEIVSDTGWEAELEEADALALSGRSGRNR